MHTNKTNACLQEKLLDTVDLAQYAIRGTEADWEAATKRIKATQSGSGTVSIKTKVRLVNTCATWYIIS